MSHLVASPEELSVAVSEIDDETISAIKKRADQHLKQKVKIHLTRNRQRQLSDIIRELSDFIAMNSGFTPRF